MSTPGVYVVLYPPRMQGGLLRGTLPLTLNDNLLIPQHHRPYLW